MRIMDFKELRTRVPYSRAHIARLEQAGKFPKRLRLGTGPRARVGWMEAEVERWIAERATRRDAPPDLPGDRPG